MIIIEFIKALILGIVEGLTEFAPVSSTGHMILVDDMWLKSSQFLGSHSAFTFKIVIQLGSVLLLHGCSVNVTSKCYISENTNMLLIVRECVLNLTD